MDFFDESLPVGERLNDVLYKEMDFFDESLPVGERLNDVL
jgi:hypothetical protein